MVNKKLSRAVVVAQLVEQSLTTPEVRGSNPVIGKIYIELKASCQNITNIFIVELFTLKRCHKKVVELTMITSSNIVHLKREVGTKYLPQKLTTY